MTISDIERSLSVHVLGTPLTPGLGEDLKNSPYLYSAIRSHHGKDGTKGPWVISLKANFQDYYALHQVSSDLMKCSIKHKQNLEKQR